VAQKHIQANRTYNGQPRNQMFMNRQIDWDLEFKKMKENIKTVASKTKHQIPSYNLQ